MAKVANEITTPDKILNCFRMHLNEQRPVTLYNTFQGLPITYEAEIAMVHSDYVGLIVHPYQTVCIKEERRTYIESKMLPALVRAYPVSIDYTNHVVMVKDLSIPNSISTDLFNSRVAPQHTVKVDIHSDDVEELTAPMLEIAVLDENQVHVAIEVPSQIPFQRLSDVELAFRLEKGGDLVQVQGQIYSLVKIRNKVEKRLEVVGKAVMRDEITILAYIARREDQIMGALDGIYKKLRKGKKRRKK